MKFHGLIAFSAALLLATDISAQSVTSKVTGAAAGATGSAGASAGVGGAPAASAGNPFAALGTPSYSAADAGTGGQWNGGVGMKMGGKTVILKGGVGVEDNRSSFRAGAAVPF